MTESVAMEAAFARVLYDDNQRLRAELVAVRAELDAARSVASKNAAEAERELMAVVAYAGGRVQRPDKEGPGEFPWRHPRLRRGKEQWNDRTWCWFIEEDEGLKEQPAA